MACIYIIRNTINDKVYIGQTIFTPEIRFRQHLKDAYSGVNRKLYIAMRELGISNFYAEKLVDCACEELDKEEVRFIQQYNSVTEGYNSNAGGAGLSAKYDIEYLEELISQGMSKKEIMQKVNVSKEYLCKLGDFSNYTVNSTGIKKPLDMYNTSHEYIMSFESMISAYDYICKKNRKIIDKRNFYNRVEQSCLIGSIAYGYIWRHKGEVFNDFDRQINVDKKVNTCDICGNPVVKSKLCRECYIKYLKYYEGMQLDRHDIPDRIKKICNIHKCKNPECNKETYYNNDYCNSCANVYSSDKPGKPSKEVFINMINSGMTLKDIANKYKRSTGTVSVWKKQYIPETADKLSINTTELTDDILVRLYNEGNSIREIATKYDMPASTVQYRLGKLSVKKQTKKIVCETNGLEFDTYKDAGEYMKLLYPYTMGAKYVGNEIRKSIENNTTLHGIKWRLK